MGREGNKLRKLIKFWNAESSDPRLQLASLLRERACNVGSHPQNIPSSANTSVNFFLASLRFARGFYCSNCFYAMKTKKCDPVHPSLNIKVECEGFSRGWGKCVGGNLCLGLSPLPIIHLCSMCVLWRIVLRFFNLRVIFVQE